MRPGVMGRILRRGAIALAVLICICAAPIAYVETSCREPTTSVAADPSPYQIEDPGYRRAEGDSYLTYPEWYIVHAYTDLAGVTRQSSESAFGYSASIAGFWHSLCRSTRAASRVGPLTADQKTTNYIIGLSFTAELVIIGAWEHTIGAVTAWLRGPRRTAEDEFALAFADDYAAFLQQTPWYRYPFGPQLLRFWRETPLGQGNLARSLERRFGLEFGIWRQCDLCGCHRRAGRVFSRRPEDQKRRDAAERGRPRRRASDSENSRFAGRGHVDRNAALSGIYRNLAQARGARQERP